MSKTIVCWIECCVLSCRDITWFTKNISGLTEICNFHPGGESFSFSSLLPAANSHYSASFYPVSPSIQMIEITFIFSIFHTEIKQDQQSAETTQASTLIYSYYVFLRCLWSIVTFSFTLVASDGKKGLKDSLIKRLAEYVKVFRGFHKCSAMHSFITLLTIEETRVSFDC